MSPLHWHILGTGSIGGLLAVRLTSAGAAVTLLMRDAARVAEYHAHGGFRLVLPDQSELHAGPSARAVGEVSSPPRLLLVTTKAPDTVDALAPLVAGDGAGQLVVLLQNGMGISERLRARWPQLRLWNAVTTAGVWRESAFHLHCVAEGQTLAGAWDDAGDTGLDAQVDALCADGIWQRVDGIRPVLWRKLAVNAVINALTAIHGCRNGDLLVIPAARAELAPLAAEVEAVAAAEGIRFDEPVLALAEQVIRLTAGNYSSMNRDVAAGRRTEIDFINGYLVERAAAHGIPAPANTRVLARIRALAPAT